MTGKLAFTLFIGLIGAIFVRVAFKIFEFLLPYIVAVLVIGLICGAIGFSWGVTVGRGQRFS